MNAMTPGAAMPMHGAPQAPAPAGGGDDLAARIAQLSDQDMAVLEGAPEVMAVLKKVMPEMGEVFDALMPQPQEQQQPAPEAEPMEGGEQAPPMPMRPKTSLGRM